jgi:hypothetical protein
VAQDEQQVLQDVDRRRLQLGLGLLLEPVVLLGTDLRSI